MNTGEKFIALENIIYQYACTQFNLNQIPPSEARVVMKCVYSRFQELCLDNDLMSRISIQQPQNTGDSVKQTGTTEEFIEALNKSGFHPDTVTHISGEEGNNDNS